jgi:hypothetical protein
LLWFVKDCFRRKEGLSAFGHFTFQLLRHLMVSLNSINSPANNKKRKLTLSKYVRRRNGVPLGGSGSMRNMLYHSLGASTFAGFWRYWNPIWGYYLGRYIYSPLMRWLPSTISLVITFVASGAIHDIVLSAVTGRTVFIFTPWFFLMGVGVAVSQALRIDYSNFAWPIRAFINISFIGVSWALAYVIMA